jgi:hypothetical protein
VQQALGVLARYVERFQRSTKSRTTQSKQQTCAFQRDIDSGDLLVACELSELRRNILDLGKIDGLDFGDCRTGA